MGTFAFRAVDLAGVPARGELEATSKAQVTEQLRQRGLIVLDVSEKRESLKLESVFQRFKSVNLRNLSVFSRQFATLIASGMPMLRSLYTLEEQTEDEMLKAAVDQRPPGRRGRQLGGRGDGVASRGSSTRSTARWSTPARARGGSRTRSTGSRSSSRSSTPCGARSSRR